MNKVAWMPTTEPQFRMLGTEAFQTATAVHLPRGVEIDAETYFSALFDRVNKLIQDSENPKETKSEIKSLLASENLELDRESLREMLRAEGLTFPFKVKANNPQAEEIINQTNALEWANAITALETKRD